MATLSRLALVLSFCLSSAVRGEALASAPVTKTELLPTGQQIIINNYVNSPPPAAVQAPPAVSDATLTARSAPPVEDAEGASFVLGSFGFGSTTQGSLGFRAGVDARALYYLGLEAEAVYEIRTGTRRSDERGGRAHAKIQLPLKSPLIDITPKAGVGYTYHSISGSKYEGPSALLGVETELFHLLVAGIEFHLPFGKKRLDGGAIYGAIRFSPRLIAGVEYAAMKLTPTARNEWASLYFSYRF